MSRRPPSARDPQKAMQSRVLPAMSRLLPGQATSRVATPLPRPLPERRSVPSGGGGASWVMDSGTSSYLVWDSEVTYPADTDTSVDYDGSSSTFQFGETINPGMYRQNELLFAEPGLYHVELWCAAISSHGTAPVFGLEVDLGLFNTYFYQSVPYHNDPSYQAVYVMFDVPIPATLDTYLSLSINPYGGPIVAFTGHGSTDSYLSCYAGMYKALAA